VKFPWGELVIFIEKSKNKSLQKPTNLVTQNHNPKDQKNQIQLNILFWQINRIIPPFHSAIFKMRLKHISEVWQLNVNNFHPFFNQKI
jgi:hypothetical protein